MMEQTQPLWYSFMALPRLCPTLFMKEMQYECVCFGLSRSWTIIRALSPKFDYFESLFLFSQKTTGCLKKPLMHRMQFSCMCYIPVTAHHAHDLFIDVLLVVFLWQHSGLLWNIYISFFIPPLSGEVIFLSGFQVFLDAPQSLVCSAELCVYAAEFCLSLSTWQKPPHLDIKEDILKVVLFIHNLAVLVLTV